MKQFLSVIMKPTLNCNAHCRHCYHRPDECSDVVMDIKTVDRVTRLVHDEYDSARYIWNGGEPLLAGEKFYKKAIAIQKDVYGKSVSRCGNTIQTNGLLLNQRFMEFCRDARINVGISFEGGFDEGLRPDIDKKVIESDLSMLVRKQHMFSIVSNIHAGNIDRMDDIYEYFRNRGISFYFSPVLRMGGAADHPEMLPDPDVYADKCIELFDRWILDKDTDIPVLPFYQYARASVTGPNVSDCAHSSCLTRWMCVYPNGDVYPCAKPCPDSYRMGNINEVGSVSELFDSDGFRNILLDSIARRKKCADCPIFDQCAGGCTIDAMADGDVTENGGFSCRVYRKLFPHIRDTIQEILDTKPDMSKYNRFIRDIVVGKLTNPNVYLPV